MNGLLFQICTISRRTITSYDNGTPVYTDVLVDSDVVCRLDFLHSRLRPSNDVGNPASFTEHLFGTLYLPPETTIDNTCYVEIEGDENKYEVIVVNQAPGFNSVHHLECDVRVITHR